MTGDRQVASFFAGVGRAGAVLAIVLAALATLTIVFNCTMLRLVRLRAS